MPRRSLAGSAAQQALAREILLVMQSQGRFFATGLPIRQPLAALADYATARKLVAKDAAKAVEAAVRANPIIFALEGEGDDLTVVTTHDGVAPGIIAEGMSHSFAHRLTEPVAAPPPEPKVRAERPLINTNWYNEIIVPADAEDEEDDEDQQEAEPSIFAELAVAHQEAAGEPPLDSAVSPAEERSEVAAELEEVVTAAADASTPAGALEQALAERSALRLIRAGVFPARPAGKLRSQRHAPDQRLHQGAGRTALRCRSPARCLRQAAHGHRFPDDLLLPQRAPRDGEGLRVRRHRRAPLVERRGVADDRLREAQGGGHRHGLPRAARISDAGGGAVRRGGGIRRAHLDVLRVRVRRPAARWRSGALLPAGVS